MGSQTTLEFIHYIEEKKKKKTIKRLFQNILFCVLQNAASLILQISMRLEVYVDISQIELKYFNIPFQTVTGLFP